ncbi:3-keto-steroid reductase [Saxophila tyrrhenica]|uniref:3-keto-steroid reductase n=1 Tax=Saxophila tyrrhenica TaxID=1690608 RepID=A0AAV9PJY0_9PEZI|nr:3-keto-steroid reductase [Saxophila tyrrhenica]
MEVQPHQAEDKTTVTVLVTGANSGLGFSICCRLIDEFLFTRPQSQSLHLLFSTRDTKKGDSTLRRLNAHLQKTLKEANASTPGISLLLEARIKLENVLVDLTRLLSVKALAKQLLTRGQHLDAVVWNAGIAGWMGIDYLAAAREVLTSVVQATTYPHFMICDVGALAKPQLSGHGSVHTFPEPALGKVFTANVFGHYMLTHWLAPLMDAGSRVVWVSSPSALPEAFEVEDLQGLGAKMAYESSKRVTDLMVLTSEGEASRESTRTFWGGREEGPRPRMYVTHPGVITTSIADISWILTLGMIAITYLARWLGSPWHCVSAYKGAVSATYAVLAPPDQLPELEEREGKGKWGSACDVFGHERVARTEIEGWGYGGELGARPSGSVPYSRTGHKEATRESREEFEETGRKVWREMEEMRVEWEKRLGKVEVDSASSVDA